MIALKFPKLEKALQKDVKDLEEDDPRRGILILNKTAYVITDNYLLACDLFDYFVLESAIEDDEEQNELKAILNHLDGKFFSKAFWEELTKGSNVSVEDGLIVLENPKYTKDLHHKFLDLDMKEILAMLITQHKYSPEEYKAVSIPFHNMKAVYDVLPSDFKDDNLVFEFFEYGKMVKFTFKKRKHFYGLMEHDVHSASENFKFSYLDESIEDMKLVLDFLNQQQAPPPPPNNQEDVSEKEE